MADMSFYRRVSDKYKIVAIIEKGDFKNYHSKFYDTFDKDIYKEVAPKLQKLFRDMNDGKLKHTIIVDYSGDVENLKPIDLEMIEALKKLGYEVDELLYKTGHVLKDKKEISILDILKTKSTKVRGYDKMKDQYEKTKNQNIKKELDFYDHIIKMKILDSSKKIDIRKLAIYDNKQSKIVLSYNHRLIASQSTRVSWTSCMDFGGGKSGKGGQYSHKVGEGASGGEFVAFLAKAGDEYTLKSPTARVLFKPYFGENTKDVIWKADKTYGTASGFREYAQKIIDKHIKPKPDVYTINPDSYNDGLPTRVFEQLHKLTEDQQLKMVKKNGDVIRHIDNPSTDVQLAAVKQRGYAIDYIKNPSTEVQLEAVKGNGDAIVHIKNPSPEVQLAAVKQNGYAIKWIENPSPVLQLEAVKQDREAINNIKNPSPEVLEYVKNSEQNK